MRLGGVEGTFVLPDEAPEKLLFISAGSGITPIMSMVRDLHRRDAINDVVHIHSARSADDVIFAERLRKIDEAHEGFDLQLHMSGERGRIAPAQLDSLCPDWRERQAYVSGRGAMLDAICEHWEREGDLQLLHMERFQPIIGGDSGEGAGGTIRFLKTDIQTECDSGLPILAAGEEAGASLPFGCRMGICHTCVGRLCSARSATSARETSTVARRDDPHLRQRPRRADRDRTLNPLRPEAMTPTALTSPTDKPESPLEHTSRREQLEALADELDGIRDRTSPPTLATATGDTSRA